MWVLGSIRSRKPKSSSRATICLRAAKRSTPSNSFRKLRCAFRQSAQIILVADQSQMALLIEHADLWQIMPAADFKVVEVMRRRDLDRARAFFRIGIVRRR